MTLIDKDALLEKLSTFHPDYTFNITAFRNFVNAEPVIEQKKGKWIEEPNCWYRCSLCGEHYPSMRGYMSHKFCPNCGARMEKEK